MDGMETGQIRMRHETRTVPAFLLGVMALVLLVAACGGDTGEEDAQVGGVDDRGTIGENTNRLRGEITLAGADELSHIPASRVVVELEDVTYADAESMLITSREYTDVITLPLQYELEWTGDLNPRGDYTVSARFYDGDGSLIFINDTAFPVLPGDSRVDFYVIAV